jgi:hypothetical protein
MPVPATPDPTFNPTFDPTKMAQRWTSINRLKSVTLIVDR